MNKRAKAYHSLKTRNKELNNKLNAYQEEMEYILSQLTNQSELERKVQEYKELADMCSEIATDLEMANTTQTDIIKAYEALVWEMEQKKNKKSLLQRLFR